MVKLDTDIRFLKGVGEKRAALFEKLDIRTVGDLLYHLPRSYIDLSAPHAIRSAPVGEVAAVAARLVEKSPEQRVKGGLSIFKLLATDDEDDLLVTFFNAKYTVAALKEGTEYIFYGKVTGTLLRREMASPLIFPKEADCRLMPIYPLTAGITSKSIVNNIATLLAQVEEIPDPLPGDMRVGYKLATLDYALRTVHRPPDMAAAQMARRRLIFGELLELALALGQVKSRRIIETVPPMADVSLEPFWRSLPFAPTNAQKRSVAEIAADLQKPVPMSRLLQGDVGSGKTMVAAAAAYFTAQNDGQTALMAPTEILAEQHYRNLSRFLTPLGVDVVVLTGSMTAKEKNAAKAKIAGKDGRGAGLVIGTHALISKDVVFANLRLVVTDEQHRFGVRQRLALSEKGEHPGILVMSATPIPRTLALIIYGDLDLSVIDELPPGRKPISTWLIDSRKREDAFGFIQKHLDKGLQAYIICPLIEEGELTPDLKPAVQYAQALQTEHFADYRLGLLHGRMKGADKDAVMQAFSENKLQLLVSTTVVEVGVDVPNAVIMMIENAERFGLSQLHQLRGRVGRGSEQSHCILLSDAKGPETMARLKVLTKTQDGFQIAEADLNLRGPGDFFGNRQHGLPGLQMADLAGDMAVLKEAQQAAEELLAQDPELEGCPLLRARVEHMIKEAGDRPN